MGLIRKVHGDSETKDLLTLEELKKAGSDLSKPAHFRHFLYFDTREATDGAARALAGAGYQVYGRPPGEPPLDNWGLRVETDRVPSVANVADMRADMERAAEGVGGEYDGWEASVVR